MARTSAELLVDRLAAWGMDTVFERLEDRMLERSLCV